LWYGLVAGLTRKIRVFAHVSNHCLLAAAKCAGLSDKATDYLRHFEEVELELDVTEDGAVQDVKLMPL
jgi:hypothetical protein